MGTSSAWSPSIDKIPHFSRNNAFNFHIATTTTTTTSSKTLRTYKHYEFFYETTMKHHHHHRQRRRRRRHRHLLNKNGDEVNCALAKQHTVQMVEL